MRTTKLIDRSDLRLYLVLDPDMCQGLDGMVQTAKVAAQNGAQVIQLRAPLWKKRMWVKAARALKEALAGTNAKLIINDQVDVALLVDADGVHVGQSDMAPEDVRRLVGPNKIIGLSISYGHECTPEDLQWVDYIGIGPIWPTDSKKDANPAVGLDGLRRIVALCDLPNVAIGGVHGDRAMQCMQHGADGVAVISAICGQSDVAQATRDLCNKIELSLKSSSSSK